MVQVIFGLIFHGDFLSHWRKIKKKSSIFAYSGIFILIMMTLLACTSYPTTTLKTLDSVSIPDEYNWVNSLAPDFQNPVNYNTISNFVNEKKGQGESQYELIGKINSSINLSHNFDDNQKKALSNLVKIIATTIYEEKPMAEITNLAASACSNKIQPTNSSADEIDPCAQLISSRVSFTQELSKTVDLCNNNYSLDSIDCRVAHEMFKNMTNDEHKFSDLIMVTNGCMAAGNYGGFSKEEIEDNKKLLINLQPKIKLLANKANEKLAVAQKENSKIEDNLNTDGAEEKNIINQNNTKNENQKIPIQGTINQQKYSTYPSVLHVDIPVGTNGLFQMEVDCSTVMSRVVGTKLNGRDFESGTKYPTPWESTDIAKEKCKNNSKASSLGKSSNDYDSCFELGRRYGRCVAISMKGGTCNSDDDFPKPIRCNGDSSFNEAMKQSLRDGLR